MEDQILFDDFDLFDASQVDAFINKLRDMDGAVKESIDWVRKLAEANKILAQRREEAYSTDAIKKMTDRTVNAYEQLTLAGTSYAKVLAVVENALGKARKGLKLETEEIMAAKGSYNELKAQYDRALTSIKAMAAETDNEKAARDAAIKTLQEYKTQLNELERSFGTQPFETGVSKLGGRLANIQKEGEEMARLRMQISELQKVQKNMATLEVGSPEAVRGAQELAENINALNAAYAKGYVTLEEYSRLIHGYLADSQALVQAEKQRTKEETLLAQAGSQVTMDAEGRVQVTNLEKMTYNELQATYKLLIEVMKNYTHEQMESEAAAKDNVATQARVTDMLAKMDQNVGKTARRWDGLRMQVTQLVREMPSAAISMNTFFLAISNNLPYFIDELSAARKEVEELKKAGKDYVPVGKQVARAFLSWNAILALVMTALSMYGADLVKFIGRLLHFEKAVDSSRKAVKGIREEVVKTNADFAKNMSTLERLRLIWQETTTVQERTQFLTKYRKELDSTSISIQTVNDAEKVFSTNTADIKQAFLDRAMAAAASKKAEEEYAKAFEEWNSKMKKRENMDALWEQVDALEALKGELAKNPYVDAIAFLEGMLDEVPKAMRVALENSGDLLSMTDQLIKGLETRIGVQRIALDKADENMKTHISNAEQYAKAYLDFESAATQGLEKIGLQSTEEQKRQKDLEARLNREQLAALKRQNKLVEDTMQDGYAKNVKRIKDGYEEERKEIENQIHNLKEFLRKEWGVIIGLTDLSTVTDPIAKGALQLISELGNQLSAVTEAEDASLGREWLAELTRRAQFARDAVQLQLDAVQKGGQEEYDLRMQLIWKEYNAEIAANNEKESTKRQNSLAIYKKYLKQEADLRREWEIQQLDYQIGNIQYQESALPQGEEQFRLQQRRIELEREKAIKENEGLAEEERKTEADINAYYDRKEMERLYSLYQWRINERKKQIDSELVLSKKGSQEQLRLLLEQNAAEAQSAIRAAELAGASEKDIELIRKRYDKLGQYIKGDFVMGVLEDYQGLSEALFNVEQHTEQDITRFALQQEKFRWEEQIKLAKAGALDWSDVQIAAAEATVEGINRQLARLEGLSGMMERIAEHGLLGVFDMTDEQYDAWSSTIDFIASNIDTIIDKYVELAEAAVDAAQEQVDAAQTVYEAELEARANGYANNVETAKAELAVEKNRLREKQRLLDEANRAQQAADMASQASSLITAIAQLYKAYAGIPFGGLIIASAAAAGMLSMFLAVRASVKSSLTSSYGGGGYEELQGGSHATGNDIDLGVRNSRGRRMKAEGGESMAIFSRRAVRRYGDAIPSVVDSFNRGDFEERYAKSFDLPAEVKYVGVQGSVDLSTIEDRLSELKAQGAERMAVLADGSIYIRKGNVTRIIKKR